MADETPNAHNALILFDGVCNLCDATVQFVIDRDPAGHFRFAALQSEAGAKTLAAHGAAPVTGDPDSVVLIERERVYTHSDAALRIARRLTGLWPVLYAFIVVPRLVRDAVYRFIARNRYRWFGRTEACRIPTPELPREVPVVTIDRITPTLRPDGRVAQHQTWLDLLFLHWRVPASMLRPLIPAELEIDTFEGDAFVGVVPFAMRDVRPVWAPSVPGVSNFLETNVRTYVHCEGRDPGVWFFSLDAANRLAVGIARAFWHLPYHHATMSLDRLPDGSVRYVSDRTASPARVDVTYRPTGAPAASQPGTLEHFLAERYVLYADVGEGDLRLGRVHHPPYPLQTAQVIDWDESLLVASGIARPAGEPMAHFASGVDVEVFSLDPLRR